MKLLNFLLSIIIFSQLCSCQNSKINFEDFGIKEVFLRNETHFKAISKLFINNKQLSFVYSKLNYKNKKYAFEFMLNKDKFNRFHFMCSENDISSEDNLFSYLKSDFVGVDKSALDIDKFLVMSNLNFKDFYRATKFSIEFDSLSILPKPNYIEFYLLGGRLINTQSEKLDLIENKEYFNISQIDPNWYIVIKK